MQQKYDAQCYQEFQHLYSRLCRFFVCAEAECPYGLPFCASFYQGLIPQLSEREMELLLFAGFRRNGNWLYSMHCTECAACLPVRLFVPEFEPNRSQRRVEKRNTEIETAVVPLLADAENTALCDKFLSTRYPDADKQSNAASYFREFFFNTITATMRVEFRLHNQLVGSSIIDVGENWMNAVYFYFDPEEGRRSPGTWNILSLINLCRLWGIDYLYLGYLIYEVSAMSYKKHFRPYQILVGEGWQTVP